MNTRLDGAERLYYDAQDLLEFDAAVVDIRLESHREDVNRWQIALNRTAFYPESGGQPSDTGRLEAVARSGARLEIPVLAVLEDAGEVWHVVEKPVGAGTAVTGRVDGARRRDHMQQHTGQHLLSAVFLRELCARTVSFHLGVESSTIDLAVDSLSRLDVVRVEDAANVLVAKDLRVSVTMVERGEAEEMLARGDLRKLPERQGPIRLVEIKGVEWNACGGTHVRSTGAIGGIAVRRVERVKQGVRVEFCCGQRMIRAARQDFELVGELGGLLSTGAGEVIDKVASMLLEARAASKARKAMLEEMADLEAQTLASTEGTLMEAEVRDVEYAKLLAAKCVALRETGAALIRSIDGERGTVVLAAGSSARVDCGATMKSALGVLGARGGGSAGMAQGGIALEQMEELLTLVRASLAPQEMPQAPQPAATWKSRD